MKQAYFDCFAGASGDMIIGSLLDAGLNISALQGELAKLPLRGYELNAEKVLKNGITGTRFSVTTTEDHTHRGLSDISFIINESSLSRSVKKSAIAIFQSIGAIEASIHNKPINEIHFHEIGAVDSIVDIVGAAIALDLLGIEAVYASPIHVGEGYVNTAHGTLPVPAPATIELLKGIPVYSRGIQAELTTPTGAAILSHFVKEFGSLPMMKISAIGYGAGMKDLSLPNLLRVYIGEAEAAMERDTIISLETNIDDMNPEFFQHVSEKLFTHGALDVYTTSVIMKKSRPGVKLTVLSREHMIDELVGIIFAETTTSGIRVNQLERRILNRETQTIATRFGDIIVKIFKQDDNIITISPEYESCRDRAITLGIPLKTVYDEAKKSAEFLTKRHA